MELLHFLETRAYNNLSGFKLGQHVMFSILRWENKLNCRPNLEVDAPYLLWFHFSDTTSQVAAVSKDIMGRLHHLTINIYREVLRIKRYFDGTKIITIDEFDYRDCPGTPWYSIVPSSALLHRMTMEGRIPFSFTNFITTQELSGPFYICPDIYHTQITEYSLLTFQE